MYIKINDTKYPARNVSQSRPIGTWFKINIINSVTIPDEISGEVAICGDNDFVLCTINADDYARHTYTGGVLTFTNEPEPVVVPEPEPDPVVIKSNLLQTIDRTCDEIIESGVDITFDETTEHFNLSTKDQLNISNLFKVVELGGTEYLYQDSSENCRVYSAAEIVKIYTTAQTLITYHTTYRNELKKYVNTLETVDELNTITYGMELPEEYQTELNEKITVAQTQMELILANVALKQSGTTDSEQTDGGNEEVTTDNITEDNNGTESEATNNTEDNSQTTTE